MNDLVNLDPTFTESGFKTKVDNIFVMLHMSLMTDNMKRVEHFLSDNVFNEFSIRLNTLNSNNERQMFDELNVKSTEILKIYETDTQYKIDVLTEEIKKKENETIKTVIETFNAQKPEPESFETEMMKILMPELLKNPNAADALLKLGEKFK